MSDIALIEETQKLRQENKKLNKITVDNKKYTREIDKLKSEIALLKNKNKRLNSFIRNGHILTLDVLVNEFLQYAEQKFDEIYSEILLSEFDLNSINNIEKLIDTLNGYIGELSTFRLDYEADIIADNPQLELLFNRINSINAKLAMHQVILELPTEKLAALYEILNDMNNTLISCIADSDKV